MPIISDDSGLEINALNNEPGLHSARYASSLGGHDNAIKEILKRLEDKEDRSARFVCDIVLLNVEDITGVRASNKKVKFVIPFIDKPLSNKVGTLLLDFLNADFSTFESAYNTFFYKYGFSLILDKYIKEFSERQENEVYMMMYVEFSKHIFFFISIFLP